jgi:hypothetical protein
VAGPSEIVSKPKTPGGQVIGNEEQQPERTDLAEVLERLNLAAVNNRAVSVSNETQELLQKFKLILKDLIRGIPTAYHDLESLLTNGDRQLQNAFGHLPEFLQKLVKQLADKSLSPELLAAAGEEASASGFNIEHAGKAVAAANMMGLKLPNLQELVAKPAALIGMLRSIISFLRARFPAVMGMNVLWSLALFRKYSPLSPVLIPMLNIISCHQRC